MKTKGAYSCNPNMLKTNEIKQNSNQPKNNAIVSSKKNAIITNDTNAANIVYIYSPPKELD